MDVVFERLDDHTCFIPLLHFKGYSELKREVILLDFATRNELDVLAQDWLRDHRIISLHESKGCMFHTTIEMSVQMVVIFKEICKEQLCTVVLEFVVNFKEILLRVQDELLESRF